MTKPAAVVTGGAGFIGSHMVDALLDAGFSVRVVDNLTGGHRSNLDHLKGNPDLACYWQDVRALEPDSAIFAGAQYVFHFAGIGDIVPSIEQPTQYMDTNVQGTVRVLECARAAAVEKFIYAASSSCYGLAAVPTREDHPIAPQYPYALSKYVGEQFSGMFSRLYGLPTVSLRYFNVYGPRQPREGAYALVMGIFLDDLKKGRPLTIHGDGSQRRDFVHVRDVVAANIAAYNSDAQDMALNVGSGENYSIKELADMISDHQVYGPRRQGDADVTLADISRIKRLTGWTPEVRFEDGLAELKEAW